MSRREAAAKRPGASAEDVAAVHDELVEFLRTAPAELQAWAQHELEALDTPNGGTPAGDQAEDDDEEFDGVVLGPDDEVDPAEDDPDAASGRAAARDAEVDDELDPELDPDFDPDLDPEPSASRPGRQGSSNVRTAANRRPAAARPSVSARALLRSRGVLVTVGLVVIAGIVVGVYRWGGGSNVPGINGKVTDQPTASSSGTPVDPNKVSALMQKISANPKDVASLAALGDLYFAAADYTTASLWQQKVLDIDAKNVTARLALGAAQFNLGNSSRAEQEWQKVVALDPKQAEAHYDLGFLYLSKNPPDLAKVRAEWSKVVAIDPNSQIAKTVATHLQSLQTASPSASAGASAGPTASPAPSAGK